MVRAGAGIFLLARAGSGAALKWTGSATLVSCKGTGTVPFTPREDICTILVIICAIGIGNQMPIEFDISLKENHCFKARRYTERTRTAVLVDYTMKMQ
jgi:hypothetical protein